MTTESLLKDEEFTLTYPTWTFDPAVLESDPDEEDVLVFPEDVQELFLAEGYVITAQLVELFEATEIDGKKAYISVGVKPVAIIVEEEELAWAEETEDGGYLTSEYNTVTPGNKVMFITDGVLAFSNDGQYLGLSIN
jgi:hypothetical protein